MGSPSDLIGCACFAASVALTACAPRAHMCTGLNECGAQAACVAGRCLHQGAAAAIESARRLVVEPVAIAYVRRGEGSAGGAVPALAALGRASDGDAHLLLRFSVPLPPGTKVLEAYLLLQRSSEVDSDPTPIPLHAVRIVDAWDARAVSWALQPRFEETRAPMTIVTPAAGSIVRLDVRGMVESWRARDARDQGIAVVADGSSVTGVAFALTASDGAGAAAHVDGPRLELYIK